MKQIFLGWDAQPLHLLRGYLHQFAQDQGAWDLSKLLLVLPTSQSARRLLELLEEAAEQDGLTLRPPELVTVGEFPERLYAPKRPFASDHAQALAWVRALESLPLEPLQRILPQPPEPGQLEAWVELGELLIRLHRELSSQRLAFENVLEYPLEAEERQRWQVLTELQNRYLKELDAVELWDRQTARQVAIDRKELKTERHLLVAFCVDLNATQKAILDAISEQVTIVTAAPAHLQKQFDRWGGLQHEAWRSASIDVAPEQLHMAIGPHDQAACLTSLLAKLGDQAACDEIAIGLANPDLANPLHQRLKRLGLELAWPIGQPLQRSSPAMLCELIADCLERNTFAEWARLARHPLLLKIVGVSAPDDTEWIIHFDQYQNEHLPLRLEIQEITELVQNFGTLETERAGPSRAYLNHLILWKQQVDEWLQPLRGANRHLAQWRRPLLQVIAKAFVAESICKDPTTMIIDDWSFAAQACERIAEAIEKVTDVPPPLDRNVSAAYVLRSALSMLRGQGMVSEPTPFAVHGIGWLDVPLDDRRYLFLMGMSEGVVPQSVTADPFLPGKLRRALSLDDNDRRHARDAYALQLTLHSGRMVQFIVGRMNADGSPIAPSRLLLARPESEIAQRVLTLFADSGPAFERIPTAPHVAHPVMPYSNAPLVIPRPLEGKAVEQMSVTSFSDYIRCPYRFYLRHVMKLRPLQDLAIELDARQIGNLIHDALEAFGREPDALRHCQDARRVYGYLLAELEKRVKLFFGRLANPTVLFQVEQAKRRLHFAAERQVQWVAEGWRIRYVEHAVDLKSKIFVPKTTMPLIGRIDRIDCNEKTGAWAILDYKTGKLGKQPREAHLGSDKQWINLQLPLYRHMAKFIDSAEIQLGYFLLPPKPSDTGIYIADFTSAELKAADDTAASIVEQIQAQVFWPPQEKYDGMDDYAVICQTRAQTRVLQSESEGHKHGST